MVEMDRVRMAIAKAVPIGVPVDGTITVGPLAGGAEIALTATAGTQAVSAANMGWFKETHSSGHLLCGLWLARRTPTNTTGHLN
jgi:hypothetical protein